MCANSFHENIDYDKPWQNLEIELMKSWILVHYVKESQVLVFSKTLARVWSLCSVKAILNEVKCPVHRMRKQKFCSENHEEGIHVQFQNVPTTRKGIIT